MTARAESTLAAYGGLNQIQSRQESTAFDVDAEFMRMLEEDVRTVDRSEFRVFSDPDELEQFFEG